MLTTHHRKHMLPVFIPKCVNQVSYKCIAVCFAFCCVKLRKWISSPTTYTSVSKLLSATGFACEGACNTCVTNIQRNIYCNVPRCRFFCYHKTCVLKWNDKANHMNYFRSDQGASKTFVCNAIACGCLRPHQPTSSVLHTSSEIPV